MIYQDPFHLFDICLVCVYDRVDGVMDAQGFERSYTVNSTILLAIQPHLIHFHQLLLEPPKVHKQIYNGALILASVAS